MNGISHIQIEMDYQKTNQGNWVLDIVTTSLRIVGAHTRRDDLIGTDFSALIQGYCRLATSHGTRLNADIKCGPCVCVCVCVLTCMHDDTYKTTRKLFICCLDSSLCVYWGDVSTRTFLTPTHICNCFTKSFHILPIYRLPCTYIHTYIHRLRQGTPQTHYCERNTKVTKLDEVWAGQSYPSVLPDIRHTGLSLGRTGAELTNYYGRSNTLC